MVTIIDKRGKDVVLTSLLKIGKVTSNEISAMFEGWGVAIAGATVVSGVVGAEASKSAAGTEAAAGQYASNATLAATQNTNALQYLMYQQSLANSSPFMQVQGEAEAALANGFGLGTPNVGTSQMYGQYASASNPNGQTQGLGANSTYGLATSMLGGGAPATSNTQPIGGSGGPTMSTAQSILGGQPVTSPNIDPTTGLPRMDSMAPSTGNASNGYAESGLTSNSASGPGAMIPGGSQPNANTATTGPGGTSTAPTTSLPGVGNVGLVNAGASQGQLNQGASSVGSGSLLANFGAAQLQSNLNPSYGFILGTGQQSTANYDAAHGISGGQASRDQTTFNQNTASTFYQQAFGNYMNQTQMNISNLSALAGNGATSAANSAAASAGSGISSNTQAGTAASNNYLTGAATASAAGTVGAANAFSGAVGGLTNSYFMNKIISNQTPPAS